MGSMFRQTNNSKIQKNKADCKSRLCHLQKKRIYCQICLIWCFCVLPAIAVGVIAVIKIVILA